MERKASSHRASGYSGSKGQEILVHHRQDDAGTGRRERITADTYQS